MTQNKGADQQHCHWWDSWSELGRTLETIRRQLQLLWMPVWSWDRQVPRNQIRLHNWDLQRSVWIWNDGWSFSLGISKRPLWCRGWKHPFDLPDESNKHLWCVPIVVHEALQVPGEKISKRKVQADARCLTPCSNWSPRTGSSCATSSSSMPNAHPLPMLVVRSVA